MTISWAHLESKILGPAREYLWQLVAGDVFANLRSLKAMDVPPSDPVTYKIWQLLQMGFSESLLAKGVALLDECVWSTALTEKQHSGVSVIKRYHPDLQQNTLTARAHLHLIRQCLPGASREEKDLARWRSRWQKLQRSEPQRVSGRHLFLRDIMKKAGIEEAHRAPEKRKYDRRRIFALHGQFWKELSSQKRQRYEQEAQSVRSQGMARKAEDLQLLLVNTALPV